MSSGLPEIAQEPLTSRETEILQLMADGLSDREISERLVLSVTTVKWHIQNIYRKLDTHRRTAAVARWREAAQATPSVDASLPVWATRFIGREREIAAISELLGDPQVRLISMTGMGGSGKTRLSVVCASACASRFPDGVLFLPLEHMTRAAQILPALAAALDLRVAPEPGLAVQISHRLRRERMLLLLDNLEHLLPDAAVVVKDILAWGPHIRLLVTSREPLHVAGETIVRLSGLEIGGSEAEALFCDRAGQIRQGFSPLAEQDTIRAICRHVDGLPLALELLAPWLSILSCSEIEEELERNITLVAGARLDLPPRQRSLETVLSQSWSLFSSDLQQQALACAVFTGGFTRHAATEVAQVDLFGLAALVDASFLRAEAGGRFTFHPLMHRFVQQRAAGHDAEWAAVRERHSAYYAALPGQRAHGWPDAANVWAGFEQVVRARQIGRIAIYAQGLWRHFEANGWFQGDMIAVDLYHAAIAVVQSAADDSDAPLMAFPSLAVLHESLGQLLAARGRYDDALDQFQAAVARSAGEPPVVRARRQRLAGNMWVPRRHDTDEALALYDQAAATLESDAGPAPSPDWLQEWIALQLDRGWCLYMRGEAHKLEQLLDELADVVQASGSPEHRCRWHLGYLTVALRRHFYRDLPASALDHAVAALAAAQESDEQSGVPWAQFCLGFAHLWRQEWDEAEQFMKAALDTADRVGDVAGTRATALAYLPLLYRRRQDIEGVEALAAGGLEVAREAKAHFYISASLAHLGWADYRRNGASAQAREWCLEAVRVGSSAAPVFPMQWMATGPLLAMALEAGNLTESIGYAIAITAPTQQRLNDPLPGLLSQALAAWDRQSPAESLDFLNQFCDQARQVGVA